jgi:indole-3-glycerol phosphate synthase
MMNILDRIVANKVKEVELKKQLITNSQLEKYPLYERETNSLVRVIRNGGTGVIAEHKRRSPSKSTINQDLNVQDVAKGYENAGASAMSVLTDSKYFGGSLEDLLLARASVKMPLLRKEFIIDEYQILEAKAHGADMILLIAAILTRNQIKSFSELAQKLNLEVLLEVHNQEELEKSIMPSLNFIGVNNRNLKTFEVSTDISKQLSKQIPDDFIKVSESGISNTKIIQDLKKFGYQGFLIGENFMKTDNPGESASSFIKEI